MDACKQEGETQTTKEILKEIEIEQSQLNDLIRNQKDLDNKVWGNDEQIFGTSKEVKKNLLKEYTLMIQKVGGKLLGV